MLKYLRPLLALLGGIPLSSALAAAELPPLELFFSPPEFHTPKLSPDGRYYSVVGIRDNIEFLAVVELATLKATPISTFPDLTLVNYWWKGSDRILMLVGDKLDWSEYRAFNLQTKKFDSLSNLGNGYLVNPLVNDAETVLFSTYKDNGVDLVRFNIRTGKSVVVQDSAPSVDRWLSNGDGQAVAGIGFKKKKWFMVLPSKTDQAWRRIELGDKNLPDFLPIAVAADQHKILGLDYATADTARVAAWNPADDTQETIWQSPEVDPESLKINWRDDESFTRAIAYETDRPRLYYLDAQDRTLAQEIDSALPGTINNIASASQDESKMIIRSISDTQPAIYYLLDRKAGRISKIGAAYSRLDPARMAQSRYFTFQSRDGFTLHGRIYLPYGAIGPHPAICLAGSDLTSRARFTFSQLDQLVASRGYAIVKIDHRGTTGFGQRLAEAGDFQIAGTMVDDLADGLQWLVKDGLIDSNRIAILGLNAGGILAIQALAHYPKLFGAWINLSTPMDSSYAEFKQVVFGRYAEEELRSRLGGDKAEREYLHTLDPLAALPKVMAPSFHYYPLNQFDNSIALGGTRIEKFLKKSQIPHVFLKGMAINNFSDFNANKDQKIREERIRIYSEMLRFLDQYLTNKR